MPPYRVSVDKSLNGLRRFLPFDVDEGFKDLLVKIWKELAVDPHSNEKHKIYNEANEEVSYLFEYKGYRMRMVYGISDKFKGVHVWHIGSRPAEGYFVMEVPRDI